MGSFTASFTVALSLLMAGIAAADVPASDVGWVRGRLETVPFERRCPAIGT